MTPPRFLQSLRWSRVRLCWLGTPDLTSLISIWVPGQDKHVAGPAVQYVLIAIVSSDLLQIPPAATERAQSWGLRDAPAPDLFPHRNANIMPLTNPQLQRVAELELAGYQECGSQHKKLVDFLWSPTCAPTGTEPLSSREGNNMMSFFPSFSSN